MADWRSGGMAVLIQNSMGDQKFTCSDNESLFFYFSAMFLLMLIAIQEDGKSVSLGWCRNVS